MPANESSSEVFGKLKAILQEYAQQLTVANDEPIFYLLRTKVFFRKKIGYVFGGVSAIGGGVKLMLSGLAGHDDVREQVSPELRKHTQDFPNVEFQASGADLTDDLLTELASLAKTCLDRLKQDRRA